MLPILFPKDEICSLFSRTTLCTLRLLHGVPERPEVPVRQSHHLATMHSARQYGKENGTAVRRHPARAHRLHRAQPARAEPQLSPWAPAAVVQHGCPSPLPPRSSPPPPATLRYAADPPLLPPSTQMGSARAKQAYGTQAPLAAKSNVMGMGAGGMGASKAVGLKPNMADTGRVGRAEQAVPAPTQGGKTFRCAQPHLTPICARAVARAVVHAVSRFAAPTSLAPTADRCPYCLTGKRRGGRRSGS